MQFRVQQMGYWLLLSMTFTMIYVAGPLCGGAKQSRAASGRAAGGRSQGIARVAGGNGGGGGRRSSGPRPPHAHRRQAKLPPQPVVHHEELYRYLQHLLNFF